MKIREYNNIVVISDTHCGCQLGLCPGRGVRLDDGGRYLPNRLQRVMWRWWEEFWQEFVPEATRREPYVVVHNGDMIDGRHHRSTTQVSQNLSDQVNIARAGAAPGAGGRPLFVVRGTEAHVGPSGESEEQLAHDLGAQADEDGRYARWELWKKVSGHLVHFLHHIGTTGSQAYEATAVHKELVEEFDESARWRQQPPACIVRSHRHRHIETRIPTSEGDAIAVVTPGWQLKTPFAYRIPGARLSVPQVGGLVVRYAHGELFVRPFVRVPARSKSI